MESLGFNEQEFTAHMAEVKRMAPAVRQAEASGHTWDRFAAIRKIYDAVDLSKRNPYPFNIDWSQILTPIEFELWCELRCSQFQARPQFPVGRYFLDFAIPEFKIGLEADGKDWHDKDADKLRDEDLWTQGWRIFRLAGHECKRLVDLDWDEVRYKVKECGDVHASFEKWKYETIDGLLAALDVIYMRRKNSDISTDEALRILDKHRLADFPIAMRAA